MKLIKWLIMVLLCGITVCELYFIANGQLSFKRSHLFALVLLNILISFNNKYSWLFLLLFCLFGIINIVVYGTYSSNGTMMEFTNTINYHMFMGSTSSVLYRFISIFPLIFYMILFVALFLKPVRRYYNLE